MSQLSNQGSDDFVVPNAENLKSLGCGCFVRVMQDSENIWVEITAIEDQFIQGVVHPELNEGSQSLAANSVIQARMDQINAMGCDRYCYCD